MTLPFSRKLIALAFAAALPFAASAAPEPADMTLDAATRSAVIDALIGSMHERYVSPETAKQMETLLRTELKAGKYDQLTSARQFAQTLTGTLSEAANDRHLGVRFSPEPLPEEGPARREPPASEVAGWVKFNSGVAQVERMQGNIGYLKIAFFPPAEHMGDIYGAAMTLLNGTRALIIDLRGNSGGSPAAVALLESYFFDQRTLMNTIYEREGNRTREFWTTRDLKGPRYGSTRPVYILTDNKTFSGGEDMSYSMQVRKRATLIGATTGGGANPGGVRRLHAHFNAFIPHGRAINPVTKTNWERVGVKPDIEVAPTEALRHARMLALRHGLDNATDPRERADLAGLLEELTSATR
ncbi:S41 family peptidase [Pseudoduganella sp. GCM10020061]|uniref:S41 family peptidase n=1 Tax=Pseudoduganella sp. GCM10020061 TaxID=3317345 RepID=UPI00364300CD